MRRKELTHWIDQPLDQTDPLDRTDLPNRTDPTRLVTRKQNWPDPTHLVDSDPLPKLDSKVSMTQDQETQFSQIVPFGLDFYLKFLWL